MRDATNKLLQYVDDGMLDMRTVLLACLDTLSEDDVADMVHANMFFDDEEDLDDDLDEELDEEADFDVNN